MVVTVVDARVAAVATVEAKRAGLGIRGIVGGVLGIGEQGRVLSAICCGLKANQIVFGVAFGGNRVVAKASGNDVLSEAGRMDAHIVEASEATMARHLARTAGVTASSGVSRVALRRSNVGLDIGLIGGVIMEANVAGVGGAGNNSLGEDIANVTLFISHFISVEDGGRRVGIVAMAMGVRVALLFVAVVVATRSVRVTVAAEDEETSQVGRQTSAANSEDKLRIFDLGGFDEAGEGLEDNGNAKGDEEDGVEKGAEDFSTNPLEKRQS